MFELPYVDLAAVVVARALETPEHCKTCFPESVRGTLNESKRNANKEGSLTIL